MRKLLCKFSWAIWFHKTKVIEQYDQYNRKLQCSICGQYFASNTRHGVVMTWDEETEKLIREKYNLEMTATQYNENPSDQPDGLKIMRARVGPGGTR